jgi:aminopeptidase N
MDRFEAIDAALAVQADKEARRVLVAALKDKYHGLRIKAIKGLDMKNDDVRNATQSILASLAQTDDNNLVRAAALTVLANLKVPGNMTLFKQALTNESYAVQGAALSGIALLDPVQGFTLAKTYEKDNRGALTTSLIGIYATNGSAEQWPFVYNEFDKANINAKVTMVRQFIGMIGKVNNSTYAQQGIAQVKDMAMKYKSLATPLSNLLQNLKQPLAQQNDTASIRVIDQAVKDIAAAK